MSNVIPPNRLIEAREAKNSAKLKECSGVTKEWIEETNIIHEACLRSGESARLHHFHIPITAKLIDPED